MSVTAWLVLFVAFVIAEALTYQMITTWFAIGAVVAAICSSNRLSVGIQIMAFLSVSAVFLVLLRPLSVKLMKGKTVRTNTDALLGEQVLVTEDADIRSGTGKIDGKEWSVRSENGESIKAGEFAKIKRIEGVKLILEKIDNENQSVR